MNSKQIDCVLEIAQTLNFNRAAENLFMSQPALSYQVKQLEEEIGFKVFDRSGRGAALTPAGAQFVSSLRGIHADLVRAVELGQNFSSRYRMSISVGLPWRSALMALPECMERMRRAHPDLDISPVFNANESLDAFLSGGQDIALTRGEVDHMAQVDVHWLYDSRIYLVTKPDDPLAQQDLVHMEDLRGRTLMVGGTSPGPLRSVQHRVLSELGIEHFNSNDHMTTLVSVAAGKGVCLSPGLLNDGSGEFAWTPFECEETIPVVLLVHSGEQREEVLELVRILCESYKGN
ncbi:MAG: LysR substrate-binding domain-containing protein, partial [Coriobacteriales bacterium]